MIYLHPFSDECDLALENAVTAFVHRFCTLATFLKHIWERVRSRRFGNFPSYEHVSANQTMSV